MHGPQRQIRVCVLLMTDADCTGRFSEKGSSGGGKQPMGKPKKVRFYGISLRMVILGMFCIGIVISIFLSISMRDTTERYNDMEKATEEYIGCQNDVNVIWDVINDLSERARNFVVTGSPEEVILYFNEIQVQKSRDLALESIKSRLVDEQTLKHLDTALKLCDRMMTTQYYAMRLSIEAYEQDVAKYPTLLQDVKISAADLALSHAEQKMKAIGMLFDKDYTLLKNQVDVRIGLCKTALIYSMETKHQESSDRLQQLLGHQRNLIIAMMVILLMVCIFVMTLVIYPLNRLIRSISSGGRLKVRGAAEIRFLSDVYNRMHEEMENANTKLGYEAAHDALTGLYNRSSYDEMRKQSEGKKVALVIVDVDLFKKVNDTYGHEMGDKVLRRVAGVLSSSFRDADKVCRIGGDEFSVIMMNVSSGMKDILARKIHDAAEILRQSENGTPAVTISVGIAFSDQVRDSENLFKKADRALYRVKAAGRDGCAFYTPEMDQ